MNRKTITYFILVALVFLATGVVNFYAQQPQIFDGNVPQSGVSLSAFRDLPNVYALGNDGTIWQKPGCSGLGFIRPINPRGVKGQPIGIDFRPADGKLYLLDDLGQIYTIDTFTGKATLATPFSTSFAGGVQSLMDFNAVVNALRLIGSNDQNFALVNSNGGNLNQTVVQTAITYAPDDLNAGLDPNITGGSYTNNFAGSTQTTFYALDYFADNLVTIAPGAPGGSSNTAGGQLRTVGKLVFPGGQPISITPTADCDIYSVRRDDGSIDNYLVGISGPLFFVADLAQIVPLAPGQTQPVTVRALIINDGGFIDIAVGLNRCK